MGPSNDPVGSEAGSDGTGRIGPYDVLELCYRAATGGVYLVRRPGSDAPVLAARARVSSGLPSAEIEETGARAVRGVRAALSFTHPGAARVVDAGEDERGAFVAWERPLGTRLDAFTERGLPLPAGNVVEIGCRLASVLGAAHRAGLVHGDLRPAHVAVAGDGSLQLVGFGLPSEGAMPSLREEESRAAPDFLAPEQVAGCAPDARSDLFSLAAVLFALATGRTPFAGASPSSVLYRIVNDPPRPLREIAPELPPALDDFFARALAKDPAGRFPDAAEFERALAELTDLPLPRGAIEPPAAEPLRPAAEATAPRVEPPAGTASRTGTARHGARPLAILGGIALALLAAALVWIVPYRLGTDPFASRRRGVEDQLERALGPLGRALRTTEPERRLAVETDPAGLEWVVQGAARRDAEGRLAFLASSDAPVTLRVEDGCRDGSATIVPRSAPERIVIGTAPRREELAVASDPAGAEVLVDGTVQAQRTPTRLMLERCREHAIELRSEGRTSRTVTLSGGDDVAAWRAALASVALSPLPKGWVVVPPAPAGLEIELLARKEGGLTRLGRAGETIELDPGPWRLVIRDPGALYEQELEVDLAEGARTTLPVRYPSLGWLSVRAVPPGGPVWVRRGRGPEVSLGETAIAKRPLAAGEYTVILVHPGTGARATRTVRVRAGETAEVRVESNAW
jgi:hypothetical protein